MAIFNKLFSWWMKKRMHQIALFTKYPVEVQREWFDDLIGLGRYTEFGLKHQFKNIKSIDDFKNQVPVHNYENLKPYIDRLMKGEQNILWPTEIKWFAKSSGTTADRSKFIPVSKEALEECHYKGGKDMLSIYCSNFENAEVFTGKTLMMGGSSQTIDPDNNSYQGDLSSIIIQNLPFWADILRTPDRETALMEDFEQKLSKMVEITTKENVTSMSGVPSWMLVLLNKILEASGEKDIHAIWPNLEVFFHGGIAFLPYKNQFEKIIPSKKMRYMETYNASEGFFGIEDFTADGELLLMLDYGIFYEFAPMDQWNEEQPKTLSLEDVEINQHYALIITTNAGLWRYKIGDTIQFTSKFPFRIKVSGRTKHFINAFGEELIIDNAERALSLACVKSGAIVDEYTAGPVYLNGNKAGRHQWIIEFKKDPDSLESFTRFLDEELRKINSDYDAKRKGNMALELLEIVKVDKGTFYQWMKSKNKLGGQNKVPRLSNNRKYLDEILNLLNNK